MNRKEVWCGGREQICSTCSYTSRMFQLYEEMLKRGCGRKIACVNNAIQIGLLQTSVANEGLRTILLSANVPDPSTKRVKKSYNTVRKEIECTNIRDMAEHRKIVKEFNSKIGNKTYKIDIQCGSCYNNAIYSGVGRTPFHPASQCTHILVEDTTSETKKTDNLEEHNTTIDPDTASYLASLDLRREGITETVSAYHIDTLHLAQNHRKFITDQSKLLDLMPGRTKKTEGKDAEQLCT
ncbi:hypothetical protein CHS0354_015868 [Potamilus streckersoni]|uniref:Mutator-like transposase domain-containing protein n=1 Tax=Potamilus streckersoni TaxID=2493646 RepID=A0AAE0SDT3_9BIVA|nr:hypothetical protein CHS0354_015868 [Potamilus streckersoni]